MRHAVARSVPLLAASEAGLRGLAAVRGLAAGGVTPLYVYPPHCRPPSPRRAPATPAPAQGEGPVPDVPVILQMCAYVPSRSDEAES